MKLMTQEIRKQIPALYAQENEPDPTVFVKFFTPWSNWTWYATEFDGEDIFFGYVEGLDNELGYFSLSELESLRGPAGLHIERDIYFMPMLLSHITGNKPQRVEIESEFADQQSSNEQQG